MEDNQPRSACIPSQQFLTVRHVLEITRKALKMYNFPVEGPARVEKDITSRKNKKPKQVISKPVVCKSSD